MISQVSKKSSITTIVLSAVFLALLLFTPFTIQDGKVLFIFQALFYDTAQSTLTGTVVSVVSCYQHSSMVQFATLPVWVSNVMRPIFDITNYAIYDIFVIDLIFGILTLALNKLKAGEVIRKIARVFSIIFGILLILFIFPAIYYVASIFIGAFNQGTIPTTDFKILLTQYGVLPACVGIIVAIAGAVFQFLWFEKHNNRKF